LFGTLLKCTSVGWGRAALVSVKTFSAAVMEGGVDSFRRNSPKAGHPWLNISKEVFIGLGSVPAHAKRLSV